MADMSALGSIYHHRMDFLVGDADSYPLYAFSYPLEVWYSSS
jgi:hypothetical protein